MDEKLGNTGEEIVSSDDYFEIVKDLEKFSEAPKLEKNPFVEGIMNKISMQREYLKDKSVMGAVNITDPNTGEIISRAEENRVFVSKKMVDKDTFTKIYFSRMKIMFSLSHPAIKVFGYFLNELEKPRNINKDLLYFDIQDCIEYCDYNSHRMVYEGLVELISLGFIAKASDPSNHYWLDPKTAFNGDRILIMEEYIKSDDGLYPTRSLPE